MPAGQPLLNVLPVPAGCALCTCAGLLLSRGSDDAWGLALMFAALTLLWLGVGFLTGGAALLFNLPELYCKRRDGTLPAATWLYLGGWLLLYRSKWFSKQYLKKLGVKLKEHDRPFDVIIPRLLCGRLMWEIPLQEGMPEVKMVIDMTCEWSEPKALRQVPRYLSVPVCDSTRPTAEQARFAATEALDFLADPDAGSVYVHCAGGYGRSAIVAAAVLLLGPTCATPEDAARHVMLARPCVNLKLKRGRSFWGVPTHLEVLHSLCEADEDSRGSRSLSESCSGSEDSCGSSEDGLFIPVIP